MLNPHAMQLTLRPRFRLPLPLGHGRCGPTASCGLVVDAYGDHALACPRTGVIERVETRVAGEAVAAEGQPTTSNAARFVEAPAG